MNDKNNEIKTKETRRKRVWKGFNFLEQEEVRVISEEKIKSILFHRGHFLLINEVLITSEEMIGKVRITEDMCLGHIMPNGKMVLKGSDFLDMAAQFLGIWIAQWPQLRSSLEGKICMPVEYGKSRFKISAIMGDLVSIRLNPRNVQARERTNYTLITGKNFTIKIEEKQKENMVSSVKLMAFNAESLAE